MPVAQDIVQTKRVSSQSVLRMGGSDEAAGAGRAEGFARSVGSSEEPFAKTRPAQQPQRLCQPDISGEQCAKAAENEMAARL